MIFEGYFQEGFIRIHGSLIDKYKIFSQEYSAGFGNFQWMQIDAGCLYIAQNDSMQCLNFTADHSQLYSSREIKIASVDKLAKDLEWVNYSED